MISGRTSVPSTESLKVWTHRKVPLGELVSWSVDQYPDAPDMAHPTARPMMTAAERIRGAPIASTRTMVAKTLKPRPINFGCPQASGFGAEISGHSA